MSRFAAISRDPDGTPVEIWIGSAESCDRFARGEKRDGNTVEITEAEETLTWDSLRASIWPSTTTGRVIARIRI